MHATIRAPALLFFLMLSCIIKKAMYLFLGWCHGCGYVMSFWMSHYRSGSLSVIVVHIANGAISVCWSHKDDTMWKRDSDYTLWIRNKSRSSGCILDKLELSQQLPEYPNNLNSSLELTRISETYRTSLCLFILWRNIYNIIQNNEWDLRRDEGGNTTH